MKCQRELKYTKIQKFLLITLPFSLKFSSSHPAPQSLAKFGRESEREEKKSGTWILAIWLEMVELTLI